MQLGKQRYRPTVYLFSSPAELIFVIRHQTPEGEHICDGATQSRAGEEREDIWEKTETDKVN